MCLFIVFSLAADFLPCYFLRFWLNEAVLRVLYVVVYKFLTRTIVPAFWGDFVIFAFWCNF